ncbi:MAG: glycosyltransferase family 39 protein [Chloroflexi bacterium]|nr:glycosyltransferase family 39 protein [Chloroflexota bacterium]
MRAGVLFAESRLGVGLAVTAACNLVLILLYLWSRGGQVTDLRIEVAGDQFVVLVDGRERLRESLPASPAGGVMIFAPNPDYRPATFPTEGRIERVRVTSRDGDVLFESDDVFRQQPSVRGRPMEAINLAKETWRDYAVDIRYRHAMEADIAVRVTPTDSVTLQLRRWSLNHSASVELFSSRSSRRLEAATSVPLEADAHRSAKGATAAVLRTYPLALALAFAAVLVGFIMSRVPASRRPVATLTFPKHVLGLMVFAMALGVVASSAYLLRIALGGVPNVADEFAYVFQGRIFASGRTSLATPPLPAAFQFAYTPFLIDHGGRWATFYTPGNSLAFVPGVVVGAPWIMPPLLAGANVLAIYALARRVYGQWTGLLASALLASSPIFLMQASSYMAHNTAIAYMLAALLSLVYMRERPYVSGALAGIFFGLMFLTRPLPAVMLFAPLLALVGGPALRAPIRNPQAQRLVAFAFAGVVMLGVYLAYNASTTGNPLQNGYQGSADLGDTVGFGGPHSVASGVDNEFSTVVALLLIQHGWPAWLGFALILAPFVLGTRHAFDWFCLAAAVFIVAGGSLFYTTSMFNGTRYVYEAVPFLILLSARGMAELAAVPARVAREAGPPLGVTVVRMPQVVASSAAAALVLASLLSWLLSSSSTIQIIPIPPSASYKADNGLFDDRLVREARRLHLSNALVSVYPCYESLAFRNCYVSVFLENNIHFDGDVVWVADLGAEKNTELFALYPCRSLFAANYDAGTITPRGSSPPRPGESCD